jgi:hypothetical protein
MFVQQFSPYACHGDTIEVTLASGLRLVAKLHADTDAGSPEENQDGFWPSLDKDDAGYIGPKSKTTLARHTARATEVLRSWNADEWFYVGVDVRAYFNDVPLTDEYSHAVWGIECNYPSKRKSNPNAYLTDTACELADAALADAKERLADIVKAGAEALELEE